MSETKKIAAGGAGGVSGGVGAVLLALKFFGAQLGIPDPEEMKDLRAAAAQVAHLESEIASLNGDLDRIEWALAWQAYGASNAGPPPPPEVFTLPR